MQDLLKFAEEQGFSLKFMSDQEILVEDKETDITVWGRERFGEWNVSLAYPSAGLPRPSISEVENFAETLMRATKVARRMNQKA